VLEVEAGRGARGNAVYRDLVRSSLIVDQRFLGLGQGSVVLSVCLVRDVMPDSAMQARTPRIMRFP
jgi:hypothetical protein